MPSVFWTGKLTFPMRLLVNANNVLALLSGNVADAEAMKSRVRDGYEGRYSDHVEKYDELGLSLQEKSAESQLEGFDFAGESVLDVGSGTGVVALRALRLGARDAVCGDISLLMLERAKRKVPPDHGSLRPCQLDAENLPFVDECFDSVISGMVFGLLPDQDRAFREMVRVVKPGGLVCVGAHGPEHYWEAIDASLRCVSKRYILGYRLEFWPRTEAELQRLAARHGVQDVHRRREVWKTTFPSGGAMYDFFAAITSSWWHGKLPPGEVQRESERERAYFERNAITALTDDVIAIYGRKPG